MFEVITFVIALSAFGLSLFALLSVCLLAARLKEEEDRTDILENKVSFVNGDNDTIQRNRPSSHRTMHSPPRKNHAE